MKTPPCIVIQCYEYSEPGTSRCREHRRIGYNSHRKERLPQDWQQRRKTVMLRDKGICYICGGSAADTIDHIVAGDDHSLENLAPVHDNVAPHCHRNKTAQEGNEAKRGAQPLSYLEYWTGRLAKENGQTPF